jgi:ABC-type lipoprotein export system ATPase subunit
MNLLGLLERPDRGEYALKGREVAKLNEETRAALRSRDIGFVFPASSTVAASECDRECRATARLRGRPRERTTS